jgi:tetratricopeptide (TPR) repeat protein
MPHPSRKKSASKKTTAEVITPQSIQGPSRAPHHPPLERHRLQKVSLLGLILITVIALGGWLLYYLKTHPIISEPMTTSPVADDKGSMGPTDSIKTAPAGPGITESAEQEREKAQTEQQRAELSQIISTLEDKGVAVWGEPLYSEMSRLRREGDALLSQSAYKAATDRYAAALKKANRLTSGTQAALQRFIEEGLAALASGRGQTARNNFQAALLIEHSNAVAQHGLDRAAHTETVMRLIESGNNHETDRKYALALADYEQALALDPEAEQAFTGRSRVSAILEEENFQHLMSAGLSALNQNDLKTARSRLLEAKAIRPDDRGVLDALAQTNQAIRQKRIEALHRTAIRAEQSEDWEKALASYQKVLGVDDNIRFAVQGTTRAQDYIRINKRIRFFLEKPTALETDRQLQNALSLLDETEGFETRGPRLNARIDQLKALVRAAQTPVRLIIESDNQTEIAVYKVGKFGRFTVRELILRPGTYTVVGSRKGYQDVRKTFRTEPGQIPQRISVICKVKV